MNKVLAWAIIFLTIGGIIYLVSNTLAPFLIAFIFAYLLQPAIDTNCRKFSLPRDVVTLGVFGLFLSSFITIMVLIAPIIYHQISAFISKIPMYKINFDSAISAWSAKLHNVDPDLANKISDSAQNFVNGTLYRNTVPVSCTLTYLVLDPGKGRIPDPQHWIRRKRKEEGSRIRNTG